MVVSDPFIHIYRYIITDEESFVIAGVCECDDCNHEFLSKKHGVDHFSIYKSDSCYIGVSDLNWMYDSLFHTFGGYDVNHDENTYSLSYQSNNKTTITNIVNEFKRFFEEDMYNRGD